MLRTLSLAEHPDLAGPMDEIESSWPRFMLHDPVARRLFGQVPELFPELQHVICNEAGEPLGRVIAVPLAPGELPDRGWDAVLEASVEHVDRPVRAVSLLEARIAPAHQGRGLSAQLLRDVRERLTHRGVTDLYGPVRPVAKAAEPATPIATYVTRIRADGLPWDPWLRVHVRLGGVIGRICPESMTIPGTLAQWRDWTGLAFDRSGEVEVPGALVPVHVRLDRDHAVYIEPNVWVHHALPG